MPLEKNIEFKCKRFTEENGGMLIKLLPFNMNGLPDRLCILPNRPMFFIEFKRDINKPGKGFALQSAVHNILRRLGQAVYVCDNCEGFKVILLKHLNLPAYDFGATS